MSGREHNSNYFMPDMTWVDPNNLSDRAFREFGGVHVIPHCHCPSSAPSWSHIKYSEFQAKRRTKLTSV